MFVFYHRKALLSINLLLLFLKKKVWFFPSPFLLLLNGNQQISDYIGILIRTHIEGIISYCFYSHNLSQNNLLIVEVLYKTKG